MLFPWPGTMFPDTSWEDVITAVVLPRTASHSALLKGSGESVLVLSPREDAHSGPFHPVDAVPKNSKVIMFPFHLHC